MVRDRVLVDHHWSRRRSRSRLLGAAIRQHYPLVLLWKKTTYLFMCLITTSHIQKTYKIFKYKLKRHGFGSCNCGNIRSMVWRRLAMDLYHCKKQLIEKIWTKYSEEPSYPANKYGSTTRKRHLPMSAIHPEKELEDIFYL